jgi:hypothetical protein
MVIVVSCYTAEKANSLRTQQNLDGTFSNFDSTLLHSSLLEVREVKPKEKKNNLP